MMYRIPSVVVAVVAFVAVAGSPLRAADVKMQDATVVKTSDGKITLTFKGDEKKHNHDVAKDAKITLDGKDAKLDSLKEGFPAKVMMDAKFVITMIEAKSKAK
jgi:hypothetical protein